MASNFLRFYLFIFREGEGEREGEVHQCVVGSHAPPSGDLACDPGMCPDWELNQQCLSSFLYIVYKHRNSYTYVVILVLIK